MGQFSWISVDTNTPIYNDGTVKQTVTMIAKMPDGSILTTVEKDYEGYGVFGGKDFYEVFADMNNVPKIDSERRIDGIGAWYHPQPDVSYIYPQLFLDTPPDLTKIDFTVQPEDDPNQGWGGCDDEEG